MTTVKPFYIFVNLSMSNIAQGHIGKNDSGKCNLTALTSIGVPKVPATSLIRSSINSCIRSTYYLFCKKDVPAAATLLVRFSSELITYTH